jgi:hypothetical protein
MEDFEEIKNAIGISDDETNPNTNERSVATRTQQPITVMSSDPITDLRTQMSKIMLENAEIKSELRELRSRVKAMSTKMVGSTKRIKAEANKSGLFQMESPTSETSRGRDLFKGEESDSLVDVRRPSSLSSNITTDTRESINPYPKANPMTNPFDAMGAGTGTSFIKNNSAIASSGYVNKKQLWGTALASYLIAAVRYYISRAGVDLLRVDEKLVVSNCIKVITTLYNHAVHRPLPETKDPVTMRLADLMARSSKDDILTTDAATWTEINEYQDGKDINFIIESVIMVAKRVPEVITHPVSQIIPFLERPMARVVSRDGKSMPVFAMNATAKVNLYPSEWETWCSILKEEALSKYIKYRLADMNEPQVIAKMVSEMRPSDLTDKKNMDRIKEIAPYTITYENRNA